MLSPKRHCDCETIDDFTRYYVNSWVGWYGNNAMEVTPCMVGNPIDHQTVSLSPLKKQGDQFLMGQRFFVSLTNLKDRLDFGAPDIGMVPDGPTVTFYSYMTPRAARKGLRLRDLRSYPFNLVEIKNKYVSVASEVLSHSQVWAAFNPEYKSLAQALDILNKGEAVGVPLSRVLAAYTLPNIAKPLLAYKRWTIGCVETPNLVSLEKMYSFYKNEIVMQLGTEVVSARTAA